MTLKDAVAKLRLQFRAAVLWKRTYRLYRRTRKHLERGLALKKKGDKYRERAAAIDKLIGVFDDG